MQLPAADDYQAIALALSPAIFASFCGYELDDWQREALTTKHNRLAIACSRQAGKSFCLSLMATHNLLFRPGSLTLLLAPTLRQSAELFLRVLLLYRSLGRPVPADSENRLSLMLENGARCISLPGGEGGSIRGYSRVDMLLVDEASRVSNEIFFATRPMLATTPNGGKIVLASTPHGRVGFFADACLLDDEDEPWQRFMIPATSIKRISPAFLAQERRALGERIYREEYLVDFSTSSDAVFDPDTVRAAFKPVDSRWKF